MTLLAALRTAATSGMVAKHLARPGSASMAMIGTGSQSEFPGLSLPGGPRNHHAQRGAHQLGTDHDF